MADHHRLRGTLCKSGRTHRGVISPLVVTTMSMSQISFTRVAHNGDERVYLYRGTYVKRLQTLRLSGTQHEMVL